MHLVVCSAHISCHPDSVPHKYSCVHWFSLFSQSFMTPFTSNLHPHVLWKNNTALSIKLTLLSLDGKLSLFWCLMDIISVGGKSCFHNSETFSIKDVLITCFFLGKFMTKRGAAVNKYFLLCSRIMGVYSTCFCFDPQCKDIGAEQVPKAVTAD